VVVLETPARVEMAGNGDRKNGDLRCFVTSWLLEINGEEENV
jgi:hypothetical protein